jgi:hypothetical protein
MHREGDALGHVTFMCCHEYMAQVRAGLHYGPWKRDFFHGPSSWSNFLKKIRFESLGPLTRCETSVDQEE